MTGRSARVVDATYTSVIPFPIRACRALPAGKEIDRANRGFYATNYARLSLPGEYQAVAAEQGIYSLPADLGPDPLAAVWCIRRPNGIVERCFYPISVDQRDAAIRELAFCGGASAERSWMNPVCRSKHSFGYFTLVDFVEVRP